MFRPHLVARTRVNPFYIVSLACVMLASVVAFVPRARTSAQLTALLIGIGAALLNLSLPPFQVRVFISFVAALAVPASFSCAVCRMVRSRISPVSSVALASALGALLVVPSAYLGLAASCLWGVCP